MSADKARVRGEPAIERQQSWKRSSRCEMGNCVEVYVSADGVQLRNSKDETKILTFTRAEWTWFIVAIRQDEFDV